MIWFGVGAVIGAVVGGAVGGIQYQIFKPWGKIFNPNGPLFQEGVDPRSLKPIRNLNKLNPSDLARVEKYGRDKVIHVFKNGYISDGHHRVANAIRYKRLVDVFIKHGDYTP